MRNDQSSSGTQPEAPASGIGLTDVYYVLFRRKWIVLTGLILGVVAAAGVWKLKQPLYQSQAKLLVKYVVETRAPVGMGAEAQVRTGESTAATVINSEVEILKSFDVAAEVVAALTPEKILPKAQGTNPVSAATAAGLVLTDLDVDVPNKGNIIRLTFEHSDPVMAQRILEQIIETYLKKHQEIHRASGWLDDVFNLQRDTLRSQLIDTEKSLKEAKAKAGVASLEEAKKMHAQQIASIQQELFKVEADLAQHSAVVKELQGAQPAAETPVAALAPVGQAAIDEYRWIVSQVEVFEKREQALLGQVTLENPQAKTNRLQLDDVKRLKAKMEKDNPGLLQAGVASPSITPQIGTIPSLDLPSLIRIVHSFEAKRTFLTNSLAGLRREANKVDAAESEIIELQRKKESLENQYSYVERNLQQTKFDQDLGSRKSANISRVQAPSPAYRDFKKVQKTTALALFGGLGAGLVLAFLVELLFDRTVKRQKDLESLFQVPMFLSIPQMRFSRSKTPALANPSANGNSHPREQKEDRLEGARSEREQGLKPFHEALRDRLVSYFDIRQMTHKPKLIAVTSCAEGAGVTSVANGLAASLSETGDGNVLLVNMRGQRGAAHAYANGKPVCGLAEALDDDTRTGAMVHENLYLVSTDSVDRELQRIVPRQFSNFVPKLKASDYDFIIFDMPPVGQTSITSKVARFMDMVLMVIESNKTDRDVALRAGALLAESKATVATVLNKQRRYVPTWLQPDFH
jgi:polysaccharide biosynthesis transport protein